MRHCRLGFPTQGAPPAKSLGLEMNCPTTGHQECCRPRSHPHPGKCPRPRWGCQAKHGPCPSYGWLLLHSCNLQENWRGILALAEKKNSRKLVVRLTCWLQVSVAHVIFTLPVNRLVALGIGEFSSSTTCRRNVRHGRSNGQPDLM